jgi:Fe-S cluster biogenesis protein NfuA
MTVKELMAVLIYFPPDGQDIPVRFANGGQLESVHVTDTDGKLSVELRGGVTTRNYSTTYTHNGRRVPVLKTISDRAEIQKITKSSASRNGYQIR